MSVRKILGWRVMLVAVILAAMVVATTAQSQAQSQEFNSRTIATYTAAQAEQGKAVYAKSCASCHGETSWRQRIRERA